MSPYFIYILDFFLLYFLSFSIRKRYLRDAYSATSAGGIVMALGIFTWSVLQNLPNNVAIFIPYVSLELLIIWIFIGESYLKCYLDRHFYIHTREVLNRFNLGTWSISTALIAMLWMKSFHVWDEVAWLLALIAVAIWIEYLRIAINDLRAMTRNSLNVKLDGSILLTTVSTQMIVCMLVIILKEWFPASMRISLIVFGYMCFTSCLIILIRSFWQSRAKQIISVWQAANSLVHAALSSCGLACLLANVVPVNVVWGTWLSATILFFGIETITVLHLLQRIYKTGLKSLREYDIAQWLRLFSYGIFYAFNLLLWQSQINFWGIRRFLPYIIDYGQYIILFLVLVQITLFFYTKYKPLSLKRFPELQKHER